MIAIDTNVLLRYLLRDEEGQAARARRVIEGGERVLITDVVLAETVWTLADRRYRATRADLIDLVNNLLQDANLCFEDDEVVWSALQAYRRTEADFADSLIVCKAEKLAVAGDELSAVYTFDDVALQLPGTAKP
ncbi:MAG: type II toxin-antitoxin system VapC family toxin [Gemmatimonadetes bacterium]|nr:type II toxin-antitoxin system VapC family toxin [Gemmatimonadota bacterium]MYB62481.1 type II toxin-antitoxin system VapC family toxin [Gemmatimonadota bacterium]